MAETRADIENLLPSTNHRLILACSTLGLGLFSSLSLFSFSHDQVSAAHTDASNLCGQAGAWFAHFCIGSWGLAAFIIPLVLIAFALVMFHHRPRTIGLRASAWTLFLFCLSGFLHLLPVSDSNSLLLLWDQSQLQGLGGRLGHFLCSENGLLVGYLGTVGSGIILAALAGVSTVMMRLGVLQLTKRVARGIRSYQERKAQRLRPKPRKSQEESEASAMAEAAASSSARIAVDEASDGDSSSQRLPVRPQRPTTIEEVNKVLIQREKDSTTDAGTSASELVSRIRQRRAELAAESSGELPSVKEEAKPVAEKPVTPREKTAVEAANAFRTAMDVPTKEPAKPEPKAISINEAPAPAVDETDAVEAKQRSIPEIKPAPDPVEEERVAPKAKPATVKKAKTQEDDYMLPSGGLLEEAPERNEEGAHAETQRTSEMIEEIFSSFKVNVKVVAATRGPVITQYELELLDAGMRVNKVANLEKELCLNLGTEGVRIVAPLPNKKTIGVEVPNATKELVVMRDLVEETNINDYALPLIIGRDVLGESMVGDLAKMPHLLVAGATGMGKSVCLNAIICSVLLFRDPADVKFILVDPKMVELAPYEDIPHLLTPPITDMTKAHAALEWACKTMDERYMALRLCGVRDIKSYNKLGEKEVIKRLEKKGKTIEDLNGVETNMPYIIIVVDEYADLMMVNKEVEKSIVRLTAKSRACGIHIILTTQRPSADVVTGLIKSNLPSRIAFRVADKNNSRVVLDCGGAENLIGRGDMLYLAPGSSSPERGQGVWVKDHEIDAIIDHVRAQGEPEYNESIINVGAIAMQGGGSGGQGAGHDWVNDRQFHEAVHMMYRHERSGADFLRRKLAIGYNKATNFVETMEDLGFLSAQNGTRPREFLQSWENWVDLLKENGVSWDEFDEIYMSPFS